MKTKEIKKLSKGDDIYHKWYGLCTIQDIMWSFGSLFGVVIRPNTQQGKNLLAQHCGSDIQDMLEDSVRMLNFRD